MAGEPVLQIEILCKRVKETDALNDGADVEILCKNDRNLMQSRRSPNLRIPVRHPVFSYASHSFQHDQPCQIQDIPSKQVILNPSISLLDEKGRIKLSDGIDKKFGQHLGRQNTQTPFCQKIKNGKENRITDTVERITGKKPRSLADFANEHAGRWRLF